MTVVVYTKAGCQACHATMRHLKKCHIPYIEASFDKCDWVRDYAHEHGIASAPVVRVDDEFWGGYRPDRIDALVG